MSTRPTVLIVDDEPSLLVTYAAILSHEGYTVTSAATVREAQRALAERSFDVLLCDYTLEGSHGGLEVLDFARARYAALPAILLTGYAAREVIDEAERRRVTLLFKPVAVPELLEAIGKLARKRSA